MLRLLVTTITTILLAGCASQEPRLPAAVAMCIQQATGPAEQTLLGQHADRAKKGYPATIQRFDYLGCRGVQGLWASSASMTQQGDALAALLLKGRAYRLGIQTSTWRDKGWAPLVATELAVLTLQSGENSVIRAWASTCSKISEGEVASFRDIETPYLTAVVGTQGIVATADAARNLAALIADQGNTHALMEAEKAGLPCTDISMSNSLSAMQENAKLFVQGNNPKALGCKAVAVEEELVLSCNKD